MVLGSLPGVGCNSKDADHLAQIGRRTMGRAAAVTGKKSDAASSPLQALRVGWEQLTVDARVSARLQWDKTLADAAIQVRASSGVVELRGTVRDINQRRRAVELAETTAGVEKVVDRLEVASR